jgi:ABC-type cobalamin transport system permease subunit
VLALKGLLEVQSGGSVAVIGKLFFIKPLKSPDFSSCYTLLVKALIKFFILLFAFTFPKHHPMDTKIVNFGLKLCCCCMKNMKKNTLCFKSPY